MASFSKMRYKRFILAVSLLSTIIGLEACCKKRTYCTADTLKVYFTGFDRASTRTVLLKRYAVTDTRHEHTLDSSFFVYNGTTPLVAGKKDTVFFGDYVATSGPLTGIYPNNDWVMILTGPGNYYTITTVLDDEHRYDLVRCNDKKSTCQSTVLHYSINGAYKDGNKLYLGK